MKRIAIVLGLTLISTISAYNDDNTLTSLRYNPKTNIITGNNS